MRSKELWLVQKNHITVKLDSNGFSWNENLQRKLNLIAKSTNLKENTGKIQSIFVIRAALWAKKLRSTADWDCSSILSESFSKQERSFSSFFLLLVPVQCLHMTFLNFISPPFTYYSILILKTFCHFKTRMCVCPLIDHRREPIKMREWLGLLYNTH